jgi:hypothetical protein
LPESSLFVRSALPDGIYRNIFTQRRKEKGFISKCQALSASQLHWCRYRHIYTVDKIMSDPDIDKRELMKALISDYDITVLPVSNEVKQLSSLYIKEGAVFSIYYTTFIPRINAILFSIFPIMLLFIFDIFTESLCLSITPICDINITEFFDNFDSFLSMNIFPGTSANNKFVDSGITIVVLILLLLKKSFWNIITGRLYPGSLPYGIL